MAELASRLYKHIELLTRRYPALKEIEQQIIDAYLLMQQSYEQGGKLLVAGNGGSAADAEHIVGELMKRFKLPRIIDPALAARLAEIDPVRGPQLSESLDPCLTAISLVAHESSITAFINDVGSADVYAQQLLGYGREGDVFLSISTSGNSENMIRAMVTAKAIGVKIIGLTGKTGGCMAPLCDVAVHAPETETYMIQEYHLPIYHCWCLMLEDYFFGK
ncbi:MAG: SIS domain-containing protein [Clostridiales bacterium]|nr:SIS domain-containing protein [Clostridiales bacterium]